jgi:hypothetical protein
MAPPRRDLKIEPFPQSMRLILPMRTIEKMLKP